MLEGFPNLSSPFRQHACATGSEGDGVKYISSVALCRTRNGAEQNNSVSPSAVVKSNKEDLHEDEEPAKNHRNEDNISNRDDFGWVAEWTKAAVLKTAVP